MRNLNPKTFLIIGHPIAHSISPRVHNAAYKVINFNNYCMGACEVTPENLQDAIQAVKNLNLGGLTVTHPHKEKILPFLDQIDSVAAEIGAVNTVVNNEGSLIGYNTDWLGYINPISELTTINSSKVAIIGAGGASRSAIYALLQRGARVTIFNRTLEKAKQLAKEFRAQALPWSQLSEIRHADIIINTTTLGMGSDQSEVINPNWVHSEQIFFETIYAPIKTSSIRVAQEKGLRIITGDALFLHQALAQFELHTGQSAPLSTMKDEINQALNV